MMTGMEGVMIIEVGIVVPTKCLGRDSCCGIL